MCISISDEMPGPWRRKHTLAAQMAEAGISISDEMTGPWRQLLFQPSRFVLIYFNLRRDARPLATRYGQRARLCKDDFNLRRDARPLATPPVDAAARVDLHFNLRRDARPLATSSCSYQRLSAVAFQSQTRCQAP